MVPPPHKAQRGDIGAIFDQLMDGLERHVNTLERIELFLAPSVGGEGQLSPVSIEYTNRLTKVLQRTWKLDSFSCDWPFSYADMILLCNKGFATCHTLNEIGISLRRGEIDPDALRVFGTMVRQHPNIVSLWLGDIGESLPDPIYALLADKKSKIEQLTLNLTTPSFKVLREMAILLDVNKSITALGITPSRYLYGRASATLPRSGEVHSVRLQALALAIRGHIERFVLYTPALRLDDDGMLTMMEAILKAPKKRRVKQVQIVCDGQISPDGGARLEALVDEYPPNEIVTNRMKHGMEQVSGIYKGELSPWTSR